MPGVSNIHVDPEGLSRIAGPFLAELMTVSLETSELLSMRKHAIVKPHLKRPGLDRMLGATGQFII